jgi:hypothetical protein
VLFPRGGSSKFCPGDGAKGSDVATWLYHMSGNDPSVPPSVNAATVGGMTPDQLKGQTGPAGISGYERVAKGQTAGSAPATTLVQLTVSCPAGKTAISGGGITTGPFFMVASFQLDESTWEVDFRTADNTPQGFGGAVFATCAYVSP